MTDAAGAGVVTEARTVQAGRVGNEQARTYLRTLAEAELRRAGEQLRDLDAAAGTDGWSAPGMEHATAERALWKVIGAGLILVAAGALDHDDVNGFVGATLPIRPAPGTAKTDE